MLAAREVLAKGAAVHELGDDAESVVVCGAQRAHADELHHVLVAHLNTARTPPERVYCNTKQRQSMHCLWVLTRCNQAVTHGYTKPSNNRCMLHCVLTGLLVG